jgi:hypothetical protein
MATQKQRRRRAKEHRHEYELVYVDPDGNEVEVEEVDDPKARKPPAKASGRGGAKAGAAKGGAKAQPRGRAGKVVQPPSWRKVIKRGAIFAPIFFATVLLLGGSKKPAAAVVQTVLLIAVFVPFSYFMDGIVWRQYQKRLAKGG